MGGVLPFGQENGPDDGLRPNRPHGRPGAPQPFEPGDNYPDTGGQQVEQGRKLVDAIDKSGKLTVKAALWFYFSDLGSWRLLLDVKESTTLGPSLTYRKIQQVLVNLGTSNGVSEPIALEDIVVAKADATVLALLRPIISTDGGLHGIRFTNNVINGQVIEDAYIYRLT
jgi:hypothetical protein